MHLSGWAGEVEGWQGTVDNDYIKEDFGLGGLLKMGTEVKITPQFAIRAVGLGSTVRQKAHCCMMRKVMVLWH